MFRKNPVAQITIVMATLLLGACDEFEQGRILRYEKGTYLGQADAPLSEEQVEELRRRATLQRAN
jgi:hypothetical protein